MNRPRVTPVVAAALVLVAAPLCSRLAAAAPSAPLADIRATPLLDDFDRPSESPLSGGGSWAQTFPGMWSSLQLVDSSHVTHQAGASPSHSHWTGQSFGGNVEAWARASGGGASGIGWGVGLFRDVGGTGTVDGYRFRIEVSTGGGSYSLRRFDNNAQTTLATAGGAPTGGPGWLLIRRNGSRIEGWRSADGSTWALAVSATDTTYTTGMHLSLGIADNSQSQILGFDDFGGGKLPDPPPAGQSNGSFCQRGSIALTGTCTLSDPVNTRTGSFVDRAEDLATPSTGVPFAWTRSYTSGDATVGPLGPGWTHTYAAFLVVLGNGDVLARGEEGQEVYFTKRTDGSFAGAAGARATLTPVAGGYELRRTDQVVYAFDTSGRLLSIEDRNGQGVALSYDAQGRLQRVTDADGRQATVSYDAAGLVAEVRAEDGRSVLYGYTAGRLTSVTDVLGQRWTYSYDPGGRLATVVDPLGHAQVTNVYGSDGRVQRQIDATGNTTEFAWDAASEVATVTDANGRAWKHDYDGGVLVGEIDPLSNVTELGHDDDLNTDSVTGPTGERTTLTYDPAGNVVTATAPPSLGSARKSFVHNARNDPTQVTDARDHVTSYTYTPEGNTESVTQDGVQVGSYTYDSAGRLLTHTDGNDATTSYKYFTATGFLESVTDPVGNRTTYTYDAAGRVATRVDPKGNVAGCGCAAQFTWRYAYDAAGRLLSETDPLGHTSSSVYDGAGRLASTRDANGRTTSYTYDDANRILTQTAPDPDGGGPLAAPVTTYTYDDVGNRLTETDPRGNTTTFAYDAANRLTSETGPDPDAGGPLAPPVTTHTYDANGNRASTVEPRGNAPGATPDDYRTTFTYDAAGRLLTETRPDPDGAGPQISPTTTNVYDPVGNLASVKDGNDHVTSYAHDAAGRLLTVTAPDAGVTTYTYDRAGNLLTRRDANNHTTTFAYDDAGRLSSETGPDPDGGGSQAAPVESYAYDPNGNRTSLTDPNGNATPTAGDGRTTYGYDRADRLTSIDFSDATPDVAFTYDDVGNRLTMTDGQGTETRAYDGLDRLVSVTRGSNTFAYLYDPMGNVTRRTYPGSLVTDYAYDAAHRLVSVTSSGQTTSYAYDVASNLTRTTLPSGNGYVETRTYDRAGRLVAVESAKGGTTLSRFASSLDPVGNPIEIVRTGSLAQTQTYSYDASDRLTGVCFEAGSCPDADDPFIRWSYDKVGNRLSEQRPTATTTYTYDARDRLLAAGATSYTYDQNGNELSAGSRTFTYDLAGRLRTATQGSTATTYLYDGDDVRSQASTGSQANRKTNFLWDTNGGLPQIALERDGNGKQLGRYVYGVRRISQTAGNSTSYFLYDGLGSSVNLTSSSGATQWTWSYEPFGSARTEQKAQGNQPGTSMRFAGEYLDPTGLYHLRARQYDPAAGRFLRPDPAGQLSNDIVISSYVYAGGRPTVMVDPSGEVFHSARLDRTLASFAASITDPDAPELGCRAVECGRRPSSAFVHPIPAGASFSICQGPHRTSGLAGYWAIDFCARPGTPILAVESGVLFAWSGHSPLATDPSTRQLARAGIFGWSLYLRGKSGTRYYYTHLGTRLPRPASGQLSVRVGQRIGRVGNWIGGYRPDHLHLGATGGTRSIERIARSPRVAGG